MARYIAIVLAGARGVQHFLWVGTLRRLQGHGAARSEAALRVYLDPFGIGCLDIAMA